MPNQIINDYIEKKKAQLGEELKHSQFIDYSRIEQFLSDMAQEIFSCLPEERTRGVKDFADKEIGEEYQPFRKGHNFCRSTFLENIKKLK